MGKPQALKKAFRNPLSYYANGKVVGVNYIIIYYYYLRNTQGNVVKLIDKTGATVVEYAYDSWGKPLSTTGSLASTLGKYNPFRYRGYVYDEETGWYYLQSRYYNPEVSRFISPDVYLSTGQGVLGHNAYAYCLNNPINMSDSTGNIAVKDILAFFREMVEGSGGGASGGPARGPIVPTGKPISNPSTNGASSTAVTPSFRATLRAVGIAIKRSKVVARLINNASKLKRTRTVMGHLSSRPYINSTLIIQNIMKAGKPMVDSSLETGLKWVVEGSYKGSFGVWELVIDTATDTIVHFLFRSK